jgi:P-type Ca2+ transporter type 2C
MTSISKTVATSSTSWHALDIDQTVTELAVNVDQGLSAEQFQSRLIQYGKNELVAVAGRSRWQILLDQFTNIMLLMLIFVAFISGVMDIWGMSQGDFKGFPFKDTIAIMSVVILNGIMGYLQESKAEDALAALKQMASPQVKVRREGRILEIDGRELVPGDIMLVEAGVKLAADARLLSAANLQVREAALTGEATAANKDHKAVLSEDVDLGDRVNILYQGTEVLVGRGEAVVTKTGMDTELGKIAAQIQGVENEPTPLQKRISQLGDVLVKGSLVLVAIVVVGGMIPSLLVGKFEMKLFRELVEVSLSMAVAVVPESLPAVITITLALGTQRMVKRNALIRKLPAVETLGSVTTICSDKTGTLTQNKMVVQRVETLQQSLSVIGEGYDPNGKFQAQGKDVDLANCADVTRMLWGCTLCNDAVLEWRDNQWQIVGDPTEGAMVVLAEKGGVDRASSTQTLPRMAEFPFDSDRKRMSVVCAQESGYITFVKGSPESILERCVGAVFGPEPELMSAAHRDRIIQQNSDLATKGLRVLGLAYREVPEIPASEEAAESELLWLGLVGILDAPRPEVRDAVAKCQTAGIRTVMITGDHQLTAQAIAEDLGIAAVGSKAISGRELATMSDLDLQEVVESTNVYARVSPEHKLRIVQALRKRGHLVAMTGDGVNDAPALKQADIGVAMGITGTDVSKEASDMILLDDNFASIVAATEEGRVVYTNIRRFIKYILGSNIGEVLVIAAAPLIGLGGVPLSPLQILWMNLVTDGLPALALAVEPPEPNVMQRAPFDPKESIFARGLGAYMIRFGVVFGVVTIIMMKIAYDYTHSATYPKAGITGAQDTWKTMVFTTLCLAQMVHALAIRSNSQLLIELNPFTNPYLLGAVSVTTLLQLSLIYFLPFQSFFGTHALDWLELGVCIGFSMLMLLWVEGEKLYNRARGK